MANQINDLSEKLERAETQLSVGGKMQGSFMPAAEKKKEESQLTKVSHDRFVALSLPFANRNLTVTRFRVDSSSKTAIELVNGLMAQVLKDALFNQSLAGSK